MNKDTNIMPYFSMSVPVAVRIIAAAENYGLCVVMVNESFTEDGLYEVVEFGILLAPYY